MSVGDDIDGRPVSGSRCVLKVGPVTDIGEEYGRTPQAGDRLLELALHLGRLDSLHRCAGQAACAGGLGSPRNAARPGVRGIYPAPAATPRPKRHGRPGQGQAAR